jgi:hypothetical protein
LAHVDRIMKRKRIRLSTYINKMEHVVVLSVVKKMGVQLIMTKKKKRRVNK